MAMNTIIGPQPSGRKSTLLGGRRAPAPAVVKASNLSSSYRDKTVLVVDNGLFASLATTLTKDFGTVMYWSPWVSAFPKSNALLVGQGLPGVIRVMSIESVVDSVDLFVFPDTYYGHLQQDLVKRGKRVFGARKAEDLELDREFSKQECAKRGVNIGPWETVVGLDALRDYLRDNDDQYVKISRTRGDMETFHSKNYSLIEPRLDALEHELGAKKFITRFVVEGAICPAVEVGYDGYTIDGQYPDKSLFGVETKDKGYLGQVRPYQALPQPLIDVNDRLSSYFAEQQARTFWSSEVRVTDNGQGYLVDPCPRMPSPPGELYQSMILNLADIFWHGAEGVLVDPKFANQWGAHIVLCSEWADKNWQAVDFPVSVEDSVRLHFSCVIDGKRYVAPQWTGCAEIGAVVATGSTPEAAIKECCRIADLVEGYYLHADTSALDCAQEEFDEVSTL